MRCRPICLQRVHYSVSVAFVVSVCRSLAVLGVLLASFAISVTVPVKIEVSSFIDRGIFAVPSRLHRRIVVRLPFSRC